MPQQHYIYSSFGEYFCNIFTLNHSFKLQKSKARRSEHTRPHALLNSDSSKNLIHIRHGHDHVYLQLFNMELIKKLDF